MSLLTACSDDDIDRVYTVGEADNAIVLRAGVNEGGAGVETRSRDDNHANHKAFTSGTKIALRIDGTWTDHSPETISQQTIATLGAASELHNSLSGYNPVRYWDDYGTADPANAGTGNGREKGLTIYGIGVDGYAATYGSSESSPTNWKEVAWNVGVPTDGLIDQSNTTNYWLAKDLLTSNNIRSGADGTYKFDDYIFDKTAAADAKKSSNILEFTHAMTKITVQLTAGEGFPGYEDGAANAKFQTAPTVTLEGFNYTGSVNVETKTSTPTTSATANIKMHLNGAGNVHTATFDALVFPGNVFENNIQILTFTADGNTLHVNAEKLNAAIDAAIVNTSINYPATSGNHTLLQAWNYLLKITVKKTDLDITATILNWNTVVAEEESPKINVDKVYGHPAQDGHKAFEKSFDLYRSTNITGSYLGTGDHAVVSFADSKYSMTPQLYWPNHSTHYFFRGVWPLVGSPDGPAPSNVHDNNIDVNNVKYEEGKYPSDLMIGRPLLTDDETPDETCKVHTSPVTQGICATEGKVHINFRYVMSQVNVRLQTTTDEDKVNLDGNTVVEIIDCYNNASIKLEDGTVDVSGKDRAALYSMNHSASGTNLETYHDAIIPQKLSETVGTETKQMKFRITVTNTDGTTDVYECIIQNIQVEEDGVKKGITEWEAGKCYVYTLTLKKTALNVTATLKDWVEVTANDEVWF